jgi:hypothetical protein
VLDDIILVPLGIELALRLIPHDLMERFRAEAEARDKEPRSLLTAAIIVGLWLAVIAWLSWELLKYQ